MKPVNIAGSVRHYFINACSIHFAILYMTGTQTEFPICLYASIIVMLLGK